MNWWRSICRARPLKWRQKTGAMPADVFGTPDDKFLLIGLTGGEGVELFELGIRRRRSW